MHRNTLLAAIVIVIAMACPGCKEGDSLEGGIAPALAGFQPVVIPPTVTERAVSIRTGSTDAGRIVLEVVLDDVDEPVRGITLKLTYPNAFSRFVRCEDGEFFPPGQCSFSEPSVGSGEVFIGRSVLGDQAAVVVGEQVIVRMEFLVFGVGAGPIVIESQNLGGGENSAVLDEINQPIFVEWFSGTLTGE